MPTEPEQEGFQAELRVLEGDPGRVAGPTEIAERFILDRRHVDTGQIAGPEQPREVHGVASIGLDLVTRLLGNQRWRDDLTAEPLARQVTRQPLTARAGFVREHQLGCLRVQATNQFVEVGLPGSDGPDEHGRIGALAQGVRDGDRIFVDVETDEKRSRLCHG